MGDHRSASGDSLEHWEQTERHHGGHDPEDAVVGRAFVVFWPVGRATWLSVPKPFDVDPGRRAGELTVRRSPGRSKIDRRRNRLGRVTVIDRRAARVLLVDATDRVLLFRGFDPARPGTRYWFTPGGGLDAGETPAEGAARELAEETGLRVAPGRAGRAGLARGHRVPVRRPLVPAGAGVLSCVRVPTWQVDTAGLRRRSSSDSIDAHRWWSLAELDATDERFYPPDLAARCCGRSLGVA